MADKPYCLYRVNRFSGFVDQHRRFCGYGQCDEDATRHVSVSTIYCANVCERCSQVIQKKHPAVVTEIETVAR